MRIYYRLKYLISGRSPMRLSDCANGVMWMRFKKKYILLERGLNINSTFYNIKINIHWK